MGDSHFNDKILTNKTNEFISWWEQTISQAKKQGGKPVLFFKKKKKKIFAATKDKPSVVNEYM